MMDKILIVEDNPQNMLVIEMTLRNQGYILLKAIDGKEALETAVKELPSLILMDIQLPKMDGLEVTRKLREIPAFCHTLIIGMTAYAMTGDRERVIESGCNAYLSKPFSPRDLRAMIAEMLLQRQGEPIGLEGDNRDQENTHN
ncbi:MAG: response regulator [Dehalococcoidales bacterium]